MFVNRVIFLASQYICADFPSGTGHNRLADMPEVDGFKGDQNSAAMKNCGASLCPPSGQTS